MDETIRSMMTNIGGLAGAGLPPANTPSSACACCGKLGSPGHGEGGFRSCSACKSMTYLVCSHTCLERDLERHATDCKTKFEMNREQDDYMKEMKTFDTMGMFSEYAKDFDSSKDLLGGDEDKNENVEEMMDIFKSIGEGDLMAKKKANIATMREDLNTRNLQLRNRQLFHATEMYRRRNGLDNVGLPPHSAKCQFCRKPAKIEADTFKVDMTRCSRCLLVRYCSRDCQKKDRKNHKKQCRDGRFE